MTTDLTQFHDELIGLVAVFRRERDAFRALGCERADYLAREPKLKAYQKMIGAGASPQQAVLAFQKELEVQSQGSIA